MELTLPFLKILRSVKDFKELNYARVVVVEEEEEEVVFTRENRGGSAQHATRATPTRSSQEQSMRLLCSCAAIRIHSSTSRIQGA